jgi:hypothetical protein
VHGSGSADLLQMSPVCYEQTSAMKLGALGVNVEGGLIKDDACVDVGTISAPVVPVTATLS